MKKVITTAMVGLISVATVGITVLVATDTADARTTAQPMRRI